MWRFAFIGCELGLLLIAIDDLEGGWLGLCYDYPGPDYYGFRFVELRLCIGTTLSGNSQVICPVFIRNLQ
jgi:hypothetical protein